MTFVRYWPWWVALGWLLVYETFAIVTKRPTLSRLVWRAQARYPPLRWIVLGAAIVVFAHFFLGWP